jgi:RND family efflux transporter MFP subunit
MKIKRKYIIGGTVAVLIAAGVYFFFIKEKSVNATKVNPENFLVEKSVSVDGQITTFNHADLSFGATGRVLNIPVKKDQKIKKGTLLAQIDAASAYQTLEALDDTVDIARRTKDEFVLEYLDSEKKKDYGDKKYKETIRKLDEAIHQAQANYKAQQANLVDTSIRAPFDGTIVNITKEVSESATAGETIITLVDNSNMYFEADLEQEDFGFIKADQDVEITLDSYEEQDIIFKGKVTEIPGFINPESNSISIKISIEPSDVPVLYGMAGEARVIIEKLENTQALTFDEVFTDDNGQEYVWTVEKQNGEDRLKRKDIEIGLEGDVYTEIKTDLNGYTIVMPENEDVEFKDGLKVNVKN